MQTKQLPSQERLREIFHYEPDTGLLRWKPRDRSEFGSDREYGIWVARYSGKVAGTKRKKLDGRKDSVVVNMRSISLGPVRAHRLIWVMLYGTIHPGMTIDHKDRNPFNNRLSNLRLATHSQQAANQRIRLTSRTGARGVREPCGGRGFQARISVNGTNIYLGTYPSIQKASQAYEEAAAKFFGEFALKVKG